MSSGSEKDVIEEGIVNHSCSVIHLTTHFDAEGNIQTSQNDEIVTKFPQISPYDDKNKSFSRYESKEVFQTAFEKKINPKLNEKNQHNNSLTREIRGYGRKADIWSVGIIIIIDEFATVILINNVNPGVTLVELSTGRPPYRNAAAAIYAVCVKKDFPTFPGNLSNEAHSFLSR
jgi:serine/threonine protein kinase